MAKYWLYPFKGMSYLVWTNLFWREATLIFLIYISKFVLIAILYYLVLFPFVLGINTVLLGPLGVTVAVVHSVLQVNLYASNLTRLSGFEYATIMFEKLVDSRADHVALVSLIYLPAVQPMIVKPQRHWSKSIPIFIIKTAIRLANYFCLFVISMIPIVGILMVKFLRSGVIGYQYSMPYLAMQNPLQLRAGDVFYRELGKYIAFGISSGLLEVLPVFSGLNIVSSYLGRGLWLLDETRTVQSGHS
ncbi:LANO_0C02454g1_1 [Lachancea nothofagi CBS 11611]|uniref:LANO_0C02454g1_1 n=1 Tax=Lachancea nothofagi CBS 11611 TaxID=1266666 RepID=A0A1G4J4V0_9SACH|nr:LANO_0C02454g1_1 [Lachancea nothofagi CBS 11611]